jgi:hypothetical protein
VTAQFGDSGFGGGFLVAGLGAIVHPHRRGEMLHGDALVMLLAAPNMGPGGGNDAFPCATCCFVAE